MWNAVGGTYLIAVQQRVCSWQLAGPPAMTGFADRLAAVRLVGFQRAGRQSGKSARARKVACPELAVPVLDV